MSKFHGPRSLLHFLPFILAACASHPVRTEPAPLPTGRSSYEIVNDLKMYYEIHGSGSPLVLLHGGGSSIQTTFGKILPLLAKHRMVIAIEQQGHGHTADTGGELTFSGMADDTNALLDAIGVDSADVLGFSNGGNVALELALRHPARVRKLVLVSSFFLRAGIRPEVRESFKRPVDLKQVPPALLAEYRRIAPNPDGFAGLSKKIMKMLNGFKDIPAKEMRGILSPALVIIGENDIILPKHAAEMAKLIPDSELRILPGAHGASIGEATNLSGDPKAPPATVRLIEDFLDKP